ncbi:MAG: TonB family protein [Myxococcales bacterium]|nr:TonB family protein [Myxococcales bacterium]
MARSKNKWTGFALVTAVLVHGTVFLVWRGTSESEAPAYDAALRRAQPDSPAAETSASLATVSLVVLSPAPELESVAGASDHWSPEEGSASPSPVVSPGSHGGRRAPGIRGQNTASHRDDQAVRSSGLWNHPSQTQAMHTTGQHKGRTTPESIERAPSAGFANRRVAAAQPRMGTDAERQGHDEGLGEGGAKGVDGREWLSADPRFDSAPQKSETQVAGTATRSSVVPLRERGDVATENSEHGAATQWASAAELSSRRRSSPFALGTASAGGAQGLGAGGRIGESVASQGDRGNAAKNGSDANSELALTSATRSNSYFYSMYQRIDKELVFPRKLALALEQGEVILRFRLDASGKVHGLKVGKSSEFREFDAEALRAFRAAGPLGPVPKALLAGRPSLIVIAPYYFRNPLIR